MWLWYVPAPDEALLISGSKHQALDTGFRIVTGRGSFVVPVKQKARILSLALREVEIVADCVTSQGIHLKVRSVTAFKIGNDEASIAGAARRFLSAPARMDEVVGQMLAGHVRSVIGAATVEQVIGHRDRVTLEIKKRSRAELETLGIVVDALEIQEIEDGTGYINNLAAPHAAAVASQARIAHAQADQEAAQRELEVAAMKAQYERDTEIRKAGFLAETQEAKARAAQAGPLAEAVASQEVIEQQTALAKREADLAAQRLEATVRRPADAEAYRKRAIAEADRDQAKLNAEADAFRMRALAEAERDQASLAADANRALADSLKDGNQELIAASKIIEQLPELVSAASRGIAGSNLTVLNGAAGVNEMLAGLVGQGLAVLDLLRSSTSAGANGDAA